MHSCIAAVNVAAQKVPNATVTVNTGLNHRYMLIVTQTHISIHNNICNVAPVLQKVVICATMLDYPF